MKDNLHPLPSVDTSAAGIDAIYNRNWPRIYDNMVQAENITRALAAERDTLLDTRADKADAWDVMAKKNETIATLRQQLAEARNAALEEARHAIGKMPVEVGQTGIVWAAQDAIKALTTPEGGQ